MGAPLDVCRDGWLQRDGGAVAFLRVRGHQCFSSVAGSTMGSSRYWPVKTPREAATDRRNNAHLVLHAIEDLEWRSGKESQKDTKTEHEFHQ